MEFNRHWIKIIDDFYMPYVMKLSSEIIALDIWAAKATFRWNQFNSYDLMNLSSFCWLSCVLFKLIGMKLWNVEWNKCVEGQYFCV